jgi:hypothetical protein
MVSERPDPAPRGLDEPKASGSDEPKASWLDDLTRTECLGGPRDGERYRTCPDPDYRSAVNRRTVRVGTVYEWVYAHRTIWDWPRMRLTEEGVN